MSDMLTLSILKETSQLLERQSLPEGLIMAGQPDTEMVEFCGFKFVQKKRHDDREFDVAKWAKRMGIRYLPKQDDSVWLK